MGRYSYTARKKTITRYHCTNNAVIYQIKVMKINVQHSFLIYSVCFNIIFRGANEEGHLNLLFMNLLDVRRAKGKITFKTNWTMDKKI